MDKKYNFFRQGALRPGDEQLQDTKLFYRNSHSIYAAQEKWQSDDRFYFTPLYMEMTYSCAGWVAEVAPDPVWLGSFVKTIRKHPELFQFQCPKCGKAVLPYRYCGSPLSGRVDLEGRCDCGWSGDESVSGWRQRAIILRDQLAADKARYYKFRLLNPGTQPATIRKLLQQL